MFSSVECFSLMNGLKSLPPPCPKSICFWSFFLLSFFIGKVLSLLPPPPGVKWFSLFIVCLPCCYSRIWSLPSSEHFIQWLFTQKWQGFFFLRCFASFLYFLSKYRETALFLCMRPGVFLSTCRIMLTQSTVWFRFLMPAPNHCSLSLGRAFFGLPSRHPPLCASEENPFVKSRHCCTRLVEV